MIFNEGAKLNKHFTMKKVSIWGLIRCKIFVCLGHFIYVDKNKMRIISICFEKKRKKMRKWAISPKYIEKLHFSPSNFQIIVEAQNKIQTEVFKALFLFKISPAFWWNHYFLFSVSFYGWKRLMKWIFLKSLLQKNLNSIGFTLLAFFTHKIRFIAKINGSTRKLVKFWTKMMP